MKMIFLGTNGWYDTDTGNTPSVFIDTKDYYIVLDAGNGFYKLDRYITENKPIHLYISHLHLDHIEGLHAISKFKFNNKMKVYVFTGMKNHLLKIFGYPFTASPDKQSFPIEVLELNEGAHLLPYHLTIKKLNHSAPTMGLRFELEGKIITYCLDTGYCENAVLLAKNADILIHECSYFTAHSSSWGHVIPEEAGELASKAKVKKLILTHFAADQYPTLKHREEAEKRAKKIFPQTIIARDGLNIKL